MEVLFICTGNTCRSPMAEAIFNAQAQKLNKEHVALSRGLSVFFTQTTNSKSLEALRGLGIEDFSHNSEQLTENDIIRCQLILTMTSAHKMALKNAFPKCKDKIFSLNEKAFGKDSDIEDPYGKSQQIYNRCASEIKEAVEKVLCMI